MSAWLMIGCVAVFTVWGLADVLIEDGYYNNRRRWTRQERRRLEREERKR